ncbi:MAG TPA: 3-hydroxyacyl-CoA dehydrogenase NAD-binding domain-containing protein [Burkholderiales bacterium]
MAVEQRAVAVIGGGIMGGDIAIVFAACGWKVHVMSPSQKTRDALPARVAAGLAKLATPPAHAANVKTYERIEDLPWRDIGIVVEAATEDLPLKQRLFAQIDMLAHPDIVLTSNTSNFPIGEIGKGLKHRARVAGLHFFMPAHLVPLVEVVSAESTDPRVAQELVALMKALGKAPIWVKKDVPGFVGNRIQHAMLREAFYLINDGIVDAEGVDTAVRYGFGFRFIACGPILQKEMSGWDTNYSVGAALYPHLYNEKAPPPFLKEMVARGEIGMKAKRGFWQWDDAKIAREKARIERCLQAGMEILKSDGAKQGNGGQGRN